MRRYLFNANQVDKTVINIPRVNKDVAKTIKEPWLNVISKVSNMLLEA